MKLYVFSLSSKVLLAVPARERALLIVLAHAINEINVLQKLLLLCNNFDPEPKWRGHAHSAQNLVLVRTLAGKLHEAWAAFQSGYFTAKLSLIYDASLDEKGANGLKGLKRYFSHSNVVSLIRNNFSFHYSIEHAETASFEGVSDDDIPIYLGVTNGNSLYQFAEFAMNRALMDAIDPTDSQKAFEQIFTEIALVVQHFNDVAQSLLFTILSNHADIPSELPTIDIGDVPMAEDISIPYYFNSPRLCGQP